MKRSTRILLPLACSIVLLSGAALAKKHGCRSGCVSQDKVLTILDPTKATYVKMEGTAFSNLSLRGDISKQAGTFLSYTDPHGVAPWHWHTPIEEFAVLTGEVVVQVQGSAPVSLKVGGYSQVPAGRTHRFRCVSENACILFTVGSGAYDLHWVDEKRHELTSAAAMARPTEVGVTW
jgi:quercetin dioxygenase-like cupin family protein